jgi:hypothetical protein
MICALIFVDSVVIVFVYLIFEFLRFFSLHRFLALASPRQKQKKKKNHHFFLWSFFCACVDDAAARATRVLTDSNYRLVLLAIF